METSGRLAAAASPAGVAAGESLGGAAGAKRPATALGVAIERSAATSGTADTSTCGDAAGGGENCGAATTSNSDVSIVTGTTLDARRSEEENAAGCGGGVRGCVRWGEGV